MCEGRGGEDVRGHLAQRRLNPCDEQVAAVAVDVQPVVPHARPVVWRFNEGEQTVLPVLLHLCVKGRRRIGGFGRGSRPHHSLPLGP